MKNIYSNDQAYQKFGEEPSPAQTLKNVPIDVTELTYEFYCSFVQQLQIRISNNMFLWTCLILVPMILATTIKVHINNYVVTINDYFLNNLESIQVIGDSPEELNLSGLSLETIDDKAFENVTHIKILNLSNNSFQLLRENMFASLTNLEQLNLSHNNMFYFSKTFVGLSNLKVLDLSNTMIMDLKPSEFFGLSKSCVILLEGTINLCTMSTEVFENESRTANISEVDDTKMDTYHRGRSLQIKICLNDTKLISSEYYTEDEKLESDCGIVRSHSDGVLFLGLLRIAEFQKGWYQLQDSSIHHIDLSSNHITRLTSEILNDLPENIRIVNLAHNIIRLEKAVIVNEHLREIRFTFNSIFEIEDDVFINTNLTTLTLSHNQLNNTKFAATLPSTLTKIELQYNKIVKISRESFSKLSELEVLMLNENYIAEIHKDSLRGLRNLKDLSLAQNKLNKIETSYFEDLTALEVLDLKSNFISELNIGVFADLKKIKKIFLGWNLLRNLTRYSLIALPNSLEVLDLQNNGLENLKADTFVNSPKYELLLNNNSIANVEDGSFNLPYLQNLDLTYNSLSVIDSGKLQGLKNLERLWLGHNNITRIEKGAFENLGSLCELVVSYNPIKKLENGTLHGLLKGNECYVELIQVPIEIIHGGVFARSVDSPYDPRFESYTENEDLIDLIQFEYS